MYMVRFLLSLAAGSSSQQLHTNCREWFERENHVERQAEVLAYFQRQLDAGAVLTSLKVTDGLEVDADRCSKLLTRYAALGTQDGDPVEYSHILQYIVYPQHHVVKSASYAMRTRSLPGAERCFPAD
jgi:hypothetical protein